MSASRYDAILWDNDGVLVDTEHLYKQATREIMAKAGVRLDDATYHEFFLKGSSGAWHLVSEQGFSAQAIEAFKAERDRRHTELLAQPGLVVEGALEVVSELHGRIPMAVVTSARRVHFDQAHRSSGIVEKLEFVLTREDYGRSKPDPEPYLAGLARIGVSPRRCLVIEDTVRGLRSAKAAGLDCWVIPTALSPPMDFQAADAQLGSIREVPAALDL